MNNTSLYSGIALFSTCPHRETVALAEHQERSLRFRANRADQIDLGIDYGVTLVK
jgi:hypothetical protein